MSTPSPRQFIPASIALLLCLPGLVHAQAIIDNSRRIEWSEAGVRGGIPNRTTICSTLSPGATASQINAAITACTGGVVFLNAGTYNLAAGITFGSRSNVTLRGAGPDQTFLRFTGSHSCGGLSANICVHGSSTVWSGGVPAANIKNWTAGYAKGATQLTLSSTAGLSAGMVIVLDQLQDTADTGGVVISDAPGFTIEGGAPGRPSRPQQQFVEVTAVNGNQITISPGLYMPNWRASQQPQAWWWGTLAATAVMDGIEDLSIDHTASSETTGIGFSNAYNGWVKNVRSLNANRNHVWMNQAARIEVRNSYFFGTKNAAAQSYGVEFFTASDALVVNNIFQHVTAPIMMGSSAGAVVAYNFLTDMYYSIPTWMMSGLQGSHDAGTGMNLFEGNSANSFLMDLYHGTGSLPTLFRNRLTGIEPGKTQGNTSVVNIWAFNRLANVVGNVLGTAGYHTVYEDSSAATTGNPERSIFLLGYSGVLEQSNSGIPYDTGVRNSLLRWGNYDYATGQARWNTAEVPAGNPVPSTQTLPASLFLSSRPGWWGTMPWPAIGPDVSGGQDPAGHAYQIPAEACYASTPRNADGTLAFDADQCYSTTTPPPDTDPPPPPPPPTPPPTSPPPASQDRVAGYGFNEGKDSQAADASSNRNTSVLSGAGWRAGKFGNAAAFNGTSSFGDAEDIDAISPQTEATFQAWVSLDAAPSDLASVFNKWNQTGDDEYIFGINPNRTLYFAWQTTGGSTWGTSSYHQASGSAQVPLGTWTHIAVVRSGTSLTFYINGNVDATRSTAMDANPFRNGTATLRIGGQGRGGRNRFFDGAIDEASIYTRALTQAELQLYSTVPMGRPSPPANVRIIR